MEQKRLEEAELLAEAAAKRESHQNTKRSGGTTRVTTEPAPPKKKKRWNTSTLADSQQTLRPGDITEEYDCMQAAADEMCQRYKRYNIFRIPHCLALTAELNHC